jgi:hypothetical protein
VRTRDPDRLLKLLPAVYRHRDIAVREPLRALLQVVTEQADLVEADIERLYANWFIETCDPWVAPYLGELVGYLPAEGTPRRDVANTIGARRRKGTLALLEQLAADIADWPARAVEGYTLLGLAQPVRLFGRGPDANRRRLTRGRTVDLRDGDALDRLAGAFDELAHTVAVGRINSTRTRRRHNLPTVALFVWRLRPYPVTRSPAFCIDRARNHYTFSILGNDLPLVTLPVAEPEPTHIAGELNVPAFIRRRAFDERTPDYYGKARSLAIWRDDQDDPVPLSSIVPADLSDWAYRPQADQVAVDPARGRLAFSPRMAPRSGVWVSYQYAFGDDLGGGEYLRPLRPVGDRAHYLVGRDQEYGGIAQALQAWQQDKAGQPAKRDAVVEITDSGVYEDPVQIVLEAGDRLELRAGQAKRPVVRLLNWHSNRPDSLEVYGPEAGEGDAGAGRPPRLVLDGLLVAGRGVRVSGSLERLVIRHCTLVPGWSIGAECEPDAVGEPSLELTDSAPELRIERSILGPVRITADAVATDPLPLTVADSILDAAGPDTPVLMGPNGWHAHVVATIVRSTIFGDVNVHAVALGEDSIFTGCLRVARRRTGCLRFCSIGRGSRTPRRYHCQPDLVRSAVAEQFRRGELTEQERDRALARETARVRPQFTSRRYGTPAYAQLDLTCAVEIVTGAHDESEMGAFHDLFQARRAASLRARLEEYTPAGMDSGIVYVT